MSTVRNASDALSPSSGPIEFADGLRKAIDTLANQYDRNGKRGWQPAEVRGLEKELHALAAAAGAAAEEMEKEASAAAAAVETPVEAAKAAFEAALEEADEDQDKVVALAVEYALALQKSPGELPPEGFYTSEESIFEALMPRGDGGIAPVKLLKTKWIKERAAKLKAATTDDERRKLRLPRRQDLERDEPEAFMSVERLKELPRKHGPAKLERLHAAASSYCWLTPAHPDPLGEQLVALAEAIEKAE